MPVAAAEKLYLTALCPPVGLQGLHRTTMRGGSGSCMRCFSQLKSGCSVPGSQGPSSTPSLPPVQDWSLARTLTVWQQCAWPMR